MPLPPSLWARLAGGRAVPLLTILVALIVIWYGAAVWLNAPQLIDAYARGQVDWSWSQLVGDAWSGERPVLPAPHQIWANC